jgi:heat shock protein HslJ
MTKTIKRTTIWRSILTITILGLIASLNAVWAQGLPAAASDQPAFKLEDAEWVLVSIEGKDGVQNVDDVSTITALFDGEKVAGSAGCNNYFAGYEVDGETLTFSPAGSTMMMCPDSEGVMQLEYSFLAALGSTQSYHINGDTLEIAYDAGSLIFAAN